MLSQINSQYNQLLVNYCLNSPDLLPELKVLVQSINASLSTESIKSLPHPVLQRLNNLCNSIISLYKHVKLNNPDLLDLNSKLLWISSKINGHYYYPYQPSIGSFIDIPSTNASTINVDDSRGLSDLFQTNLSDCSFVSAVQSIVNYDTSLLRSVIQKGPNDTYYILFNINGCRRLCIVNSDIHSDHITSSSNSRLLWPALMEKAFLQVHGCTDISAFRGSNFGNDCYLLTSYLPEYIPIQELTRSLIDSIYQEFLSKNVLLGLAVGRLTDDEVLAFHLVPNHDYCITDITLSNDDYLFTIRNPSLATNPFQTLSLKDLYAMFQTFYVNWNSDRFAHGAKKTFVIPSTIGSSSYIDYPQFTIHGAPSSSIWILLEGHMGREGTGSVISSVLCYDTDHKLWNSDDSEFISSTPVNNPLFTLCKLSVPADGCLTAVLRLTDVTSSHFYTIHCYSQEPLSIHRSTNKLKHFKQLAGSWTIGESGGPWSEDTYWENPQYEITTEDTSPVSIGLFTSSSLHVSLNIFDNDFNDFNRVVGFKEKDLIQSEQYTDGLSLSRTTLQAGKKYVIVCSTYHVNDLGAFKLAVNSNSLFSLRPLLTGLGLFKKRIDGANVSRRGWETIARFLLKRRSRVAVKVTGKINRAQLRGTQTGEVVYSAVSSRKTTFLGSQKETISDGEYEVQVTSEKDCTVDAEIWTDYIISSTDER